MSSLNTQIEFQMLKYVFVALFIVAGTDKLLNLLTDWTQYLSPSVVETWPFSPSLLMVIIGFFEIAIGLTVVKKTGFGGHMAAFWLLLIALSLFVNHHERLATCNLILALSAFIMAQMARIIKRNKQLVRVNSKNHE